MKPDMPASQFCARFQEALQRFLDGDVDSFDAACDEHRTECACCRTDYLAARQLVRGLRQLEKPQLPAALTERLVDAVFSDQTRPAQSKTARQWLAVLAIAASICLAIAIGMRIGPGKPPRPPEPTPNVVATRPADQTIALEESFAQASSAVASMSRRAADQTLEPARTLISTAADTPVLTVDPMATAIEPANQSLATFREGAALGLEPVANSARRAVSLFWRDLPLDRKQKNDF